MIRLKRTPPIALVLCLAVVVPCLRAGEYPDADALMQIVRGRFPRDPLHMSGRLTVRRRHGVVERRVNIEIRAHWGAEPIWAVYTLRDAFGKDLEEVRLTRAAGRPPQFSYAAGSSLTKTKLPDLWKVIQGTDVSWMDLALDFLWWRGGKVTGTESVKGRSCYVVDIPAPPDAASPYASVRLWIDDSQYMLMKAEGSAKDGKVMRRLWVDSLQKINDQWMVQNLEIQSYPVAHRTKLTIIEAGVDTGS